MLRRETLRFMAVMSVLLLTSCSTYESERRVVQEDGMSTNCPVLNESTNTPSKPIPITNPIPEKIALGSIVVRAEPFVQVPQKEDDPARVRFLVPLPDGSGRLAIIDQDGRIYLADAEGKSLALYLDLAAADVDFYIEKRAKPEMGLMGIAFHPDFGARHKLGYGKFYTSHGVMSGSGVADYLESESNRHESVVREWTVTNPSSDEFVGVSREIFRVGQKTPFHDISKVAFNPTVRSNHPDYGMLYIALGDDSADFDSKKHAQNLRLPLGAILRIDPFGGGRHLWLRKLGAVLGIRQFTNEDERNYGIPADNPFIDRDDVIPEIWAYGLRHPQHFSWDSDGRMFIADIGQFHIEEVNLGIAGANYGSPLREGTFATWHAYGRDFEWHPLYPCPEPDAMDYIYPIVQYDHTEDEYRRTAIGGSIVYRGEAIPALQGRLVLVDMPSGRLFHTGADGMDLDRRQTIFELQLEFPNGGNSLLEVTVRDPRDYRAHARLGVDAAGELYVLTKSDGMVRRLVAAAGVRGVEL